MHLMSELPFTLLAASWWLEPATWVAIAKVALGLGAVIFVHELGHFLVAKWCGVKCEKFYIGFDVPIHIGPIALPAALWKKQWGETEYGIGIIPLGGYVKMLGQDDNPANAEAEAERTKVYDQSAAEGQPADESAPKSYQLDPRSYPAKSVPQRMAIISAGVIMNVIFAVIFASVAYDLGVSYLPCGIGGTIPGDPAWVADLEPGDRIVRIGKTGPLHEHLRFDKDLKLAVLTAGPKHDVDLLIRSPDGKTREVSIRPTDAHKKELIFSTIGVAPIATTVFDKNKPVAQAYPAAELKEGIQGGDKIVAVEIDGAMHQLGEKDLELQALLAQHPDREMTLVIHRSASPEAEQGAGASAPQTVRIAVPPTPLKRLGLVMKLGPIAAVQANSPATKAGLKAGDTLLRIDGQEPGDPLLLSEELTRKAGQEVTLEISRAGGATETIPITPRLPVQYANSLLSGAVLGIEPLGIACEVENVVAQVEPSGAAAAAGLAAGDVLESAQFVPGDEKQKDDKYMQDFFKEPIPLAQEDRRDWVVVNGQLQATLPGTDVKLTYKRGKETKSVVLTPEVSTQWFNPERGFRLVLTQEVHQAASVGEACALGVRETKESLLQVITFLKKLVSREVPVSGLGGPGTIAVVATMEASESTARLLVFLTLLSANLAVINFLPIPVLDGGHMVFLAYEGICGRPVDEKWAFRLTLMGLSFILGLMVLVIGLDVARFTGLGAG